MSARINILPPDTAGEGMIDFPMEFSASLQPPPVPCIKGVVSADQIKLTGEAMGQPFELVVKKAK